MSNFWTPATLPVVLEFRFRTENRLLRWLRRLFGPRPSREAVTISNIYDALVLSAGPASGATNHIGSEALNIPENKSIDFIVKRFYLHESFLFTAFCIAEGSEGSAVDVSLPYTAQVVAKLRSEWSAREGEFSSAEEIGNRCFGLVENLVGDPIGWSRAWLSEFGTSSHFSEAHVEGWAIQCKKELLTFKRFAEDVVEQENSTTN